MENIHLRFKEIRLKQGLTQTEMATKLGMKQPAWARLENGGVPDPRSSTIVDLCKTFKVDANWLLGLSTEVNVLNVYDVIKEKPVLSVREVTGIKKRG